MNTKNRNLTIPICGMLITFGTCLVSCGKAPAQSTSSSGNVNLMAHPLSGVNAAFLPFRLFNLILGIHEAFAAVSTFNSFKICNDTLVITDVNGNTVPVSGNSIGKGLGLLTFNPAATTATELSSFNLPANTVIKEIDITSAVTPSVCSGVNYAVSFDPGSGPILVTQNTSFKFQFANPVAVSGTTSNPQSLTLLFGQIVNGMVALGNTLNDSTIQSVTMGQGQ